MDRGRRKDTMKKCSYCGRDNADEALNCKECGTEFEREVLDSEVTSGGLYDEKKTLTIRIFSSYEDAGQAAAKLEAYGIKCWVNADDCGGWYPNLTAAAGVRLHVLAEDAEIAVALLEAKPSPAENKQIEIEAVLATPPKPDPKKTGLGANLGRHFPWDSYLPTLPVEKRTLNDYPLSIHSRWQARRRMEISQWAIG